MFSNHKSKHAGVLLPFSLCLKDTLSGTTSEAWRPTEKLSRNQICSLDQVRLASALMSYNSAKGSA
jgi:hypothetical protein